MDRLYISGSVTGKPDGNRAAFADAKMSLYEAGITAFDPHDLVIPSDSHATPLPRTEAPC